MMTDYHEQAWQRVSLEIYRAQGKSGEQPLQSMQKPLAELGLDSLKVIEIVYQLETFFQLDVDEERLSQLENVGDLVELFSSALTTTGGVAMDVANVGTHVR
jgi:acyl carrier protein